MANLKEVRDRIKSVMSTQQITKAMKLVAASKLRRAQQAIVQLRPYSEKLNAMLSNIMAFVEDDANSEYSVERNVNKVCLVVITSNRGLCGAFNNHIIKRAMKYIEKNKQADVICIGRKGYVYLKKHTDKIIKYYTDLFNRMDFTVSRDVAQFIKKIYLEENYSEIDVIYNEFKSAIQQDVVEKQLFPIELESDKPEPEKNQSETTAEENESEEKAATPDYIYEPDDETIIDELGNKYIDKEIWRIMLESSAAEQGARMAAMDSATDNASDLIENLTLKYNRARQAGITKEIIEIASGAEALK